MAEVVNVKVEYPGFSHRRLELGPDPVRATVAFALGVGEHVLAKIPGNPQLAQ